VQILPLKKTPLPLLHSQVGTLPKGATLVVCPPLRLEGAPQGVVMGGGRLAMGGACLATGGCSLDMARYPYQGHYILDQQVDRGALQGHAVFVF
jgi:hypothetical protein